ncbi:MAG: hypothetical protein LH618_13875 [Saprospiraceae bacterium]|nr:hypothetical protein [Saprospiraceae bacterium]
MSSAEAKEYGLVDEVLDRNNPKARAAQDKKDKEKE